MTDIAMPPGAAAATAGPDAGTGGPGPRGEQEIAALAELHTRLLDTLEGYETLIAKAEPEFRAVAEEFRVLHRAQEAAIARMLHGLGHDPDRDGSVFGTVNRAMVEVRSWFDDIGHNVMEALVQGEKHVMEGFEAAILASPSLTRRGLLQEMRADLAALLARHTENAA